MLVCTFLRGDFLVLYVPKAPLDKGSLGCVQIKKIQCKKVQSDKIRLHLLFIANILRKLLTNLIPTYQAARSQTYVR